MAKTIDVYKDWLQIPDPQPLNFYQLLKIPKFEDDAVKIRASYRQLNAHVRKYGAGEYGPQSQALLNELAKAMLCLTDRQRKTEYDASLGRPAGQESGRRTLEEILVGRKVLQPPQLDKARNFAKAVGVELRDAVLQQKLSTPEIVMQCYAEAIGLPYVDLADVGVSPELAPKVPATMARQNSCAPLMIDDKQVLIASPNPLPPEIEDFLRLQFGMPIRTVLCTPAGINDAIARFYPKEAAAAELAAASGVKGPAPSAGGRAAAGAAPAANPDAFKNAALAGVLGFAIVATLVSFGLQLGASRWAAKNTASVYLYSLVAGSVAGAAGFFSQRR
jgi:hypothetical protein